MERSGYHPETLLELWKRASAEAHYRQESEAAGHQLDFGEKAVRLDAGWIYHGDRLVSGEYHPDGGRWPGDGALILSQGWSCKHVRFP